MSGALVHITPGGYKTYIIGGCALIVVGFGLLSTLSETTSRVQEIFYLIVVGIGFGSILQMCTLAVQSAADKEGLLSNLISYK